MTAWALAALAGSVILGWLGDAAAIEVFHANRRDGVLRWLASITDLGQSHWYLVPAALAAISIGLADWSRRDSRGRARLSFLFGQAGFVFAAVALSGILVNVAKFLVGRARPRLRDEVGTFGFDPFGFDYLYHSYPSGHSTTVGAVALVLMLWFPRRWAAILVLTGLLAFSRVAALAHYPSDVVAGYAFGFLSSLFLARWLARRGVVFRVVEGSLLPVLRHARAWRAVLPRH